MKTWLRRYACGMLASICLLSCAASSHAGEPAEGGKYADKKLVALTFDDGPSIYTMAILDILEEHGARATFCVLGNLVKRYEPTIVRAHKMGCEVIGHSWTHPNFTKQTRVQIFDQIDMTQRAIAGATGAQPPMLYRPPYGLGPNNKKVPSVSQEMGYMMVMWSFAADKSSKARNTRLNVQYEVFDGAVVLMHDTRESTRNALRDIVPLLIEDGYELVTVSELLAATGQPIEPGCAWYGPSRPLVSP